MELLEATNLVLKHRETEKQVLIDKLKFLETLSLCSGIITLPQWLSKYCCTTHNILKHWRNLGLQEMGQEHTKGCKPENEYVWPKACFFGPWQTSDTEARRTQQLGWKGIPGEHQRPLGCHRGPITEFVEHQVQNVTECGCKGIIQESCWSNIFTHTHTHTHMSAVDFKEGVKFASRP